MTLRRLPAVQIYEEPLSIPRRWQAWRQRLRGDRTDLVDVFTRLTLPMRPTPESIDRQISRASALCDAALFMMWLARIAARETGRTLRLPQSLGVLIDLRPASVVAFSDSLAANGVYDEDLDELTRREFDRCWHVETDFHKDLMAYLFRPDVYLQPALQAQQDIRDLMRTMGDFPAFVKAAASREVQSATSDSVVALGSLFAALLAQDDTIQQMVVEINDQSRASWSALYREALEHYGQSRASWNALYHEALKHYGGRSSDGLEVEDFTGMSAMRTVNVLGDFRQDQSGRKTGGARASQGADQPDLLMSIYIPNERLYAAEQRRALTLFRDWLMKTRKHGIRESERSTTRGAMYEYYADTSVSLSELKAEIDVFSHFLNKCADSPAAALRMLSETQMSPMAASELVAQFGKEVRRFEVDARHARERGVLALKQTLENTLIEAGVDLRIVPGAQIDAMLEELVPRPDPAAPLPGLRGRKSSTCRRTSTFPFIKRSTVRWSRQSSSMSRAR